VEVDCNVKNKEVTMNRKMKKVSIFIPAAVFAIVFVMVFLTNCEQEHEPEGFGYETNGILEGTVWVKGDTTLSFSKNAVTVNRSLYQGEKSLTPGTHYSFLRVFDSIYGRQAGTVSVQAYSSYYGEVEFYLYLDGVVLFDNTHYFDDWEWRVDGLFFPPPDTLFINGKERSYNNFVAEETEGGLAITKYGGNLRNVVIPAEIGGMPVVAIGDGDSSPFRRYYNTTMLQLASVTIPPSVTTVRPGVFLSDDFFGWFKTSGVYLSEGITIGADVTIMGDNALAGWDQGWGMLDPSGNGNFIGYEAEHIGGRLDMGFVEFYNKNGRQAGKYTWEVASYDSYNYKYTFSWTFTPAP